MSPRWFDGSNYLALETGPLARFWTTALAGLVDCGYVKATGHSVAINLPRTATRPEVGYEWRIPYDRAGKPISNAIERNRARIYFHAYAAGVSLHFIENALTELRAGRTATSEPYRVAKESISCGFTEEARGALNHHMVVRRRKIVNYNIISPTSWNISPRDIYDTRGPCEDAVQNTPIFEENPKDEFKGIDLTRAVRSFTPDVDGVDIIPTFR
jgi:hydrogenase large subunit